MKQFLFLFAIIPTLLFGQNEAKYLANAVPTEDGKVVFTKEIKVPALNRNQIYDALKDWCKKTFNSETSKVVYSNKEDGDIIAAGESELVFQKTALSLDKAKMTYRFTAKVENNECSLRVSNIRYSYNVSYQKQPEKYTAEEWITDDAALNKKGTKLNRGNGKFRTKTIDCVDELFDSATAALGVKSMGNNATGDATPVPANVKPQVKEPTATQKADYTAYEADKLPKAIKSQLAKKHLKVVGSNKKNTLDEKATFDKIDSMFGKDVVLVSVSNSSKLNKDVKQNDVYELQFFDNGESTPSIIIECSLQGKTQSNDNVIVMGEIKNIWVE